MSILNNSFWRSHCILLGDCPGYRSHRMYPFRFTLCRGKEGPSSGQEWLLRWWKCQSQLISGLHTLYCSTMASQCISVIPQVSSKTSSTSQYRSQPRFDLVPNFILASGELTKLLLHTDVTRYLEFKQIAGSFIYHDGKISRVPSTEMEAAKSPLMGLFERRHAKKFFKFLQGWKDEDPTTHQGT